MTRSERLEAIRKRAEAATPGPWKATDHADESGSAWICLSGERFTPLAQGYDGEFLNRPDADFIAAAREDIPWLLGEVEQMRTALEIILKQSTVNIDPPYALFRLSAIADEAREGLAEP